MEVFYCFDIWTGFTNHPISIVMILRAWVDFLPSRTFSANYIYELLQFQYFEAIFVKTSTWSVRQMQLECSDGYALNLKYPIEWRVNGYGWGPSL